MFCSLEKVVVVVYRIERSLAGVVGELSIMHAVFGSDYFRHPVLKVPPPRVSKRSVSIF